MVRGTHTPLDHHSLVDKTHSDDDDRSQRTTVLLILDAGRADQITPETMPFLSGLAQNSIVAAFKDPTGARAEALYFSGRYPDQEPQGAFLFDPEAGKDRLPHRFKTPRTARMIQRARLPITLGLERLSGRIGHRTGHHSTDNTPPHLVSFFGTDSDSLPDTEARLPAGSIFDLCREHGRNYRYLGPAPNVSPEEIHDTLVREIRDGLPRDLFVARLSAPARQRVGDHTLHRTYLRDLDDKVASIHAALTARYGSWDLLVCGEDALTPADQEIDLRSALAKTDAKPGTDYILYTTSTLAFIWYLTAKGRLVIEQTLPRIEGTIILDEQGRRARRLPVDRRWGDRLLATRPGKVFATKTVYGPLQVRRSPVKSPRGDPHRVAILASNNGHTPPSHLGQRPLVDVFPTLCELVGVPLPNNHEGKSLIQREDHDALH